MGARRYAVLLGRDGSAQPRGNCSSSITCLLDIDFSAKVASAAACAKALAKVDSDALPYDRKAPAACEVAFSAVDVVEGASAEGGPCVDSLQCAGWLVCTSDGDACGTCVAAPGEGEPCTAFGECAQGLFCGSDDTCGLKPALGDACDDECVGLAVCVDGTCQAAPRVEPAAA